MTPQNPAVDAEIKTASMLVIDYEFKGIVENGLDYVQRNRKRYQRTILASSYYDDIAIQERAVKMGINLVPKSWSFRIPIAVEEGREADAILIDDDVLVHSVWRSVAEASAKKIFCYASYESFLEESDLFDRTTPVYVDLNLNGQSGVTVGQRMKEQGFNHLHLATGDLMFVPEDGVFISVMGKEPPWSI